jgi:hypothetical protein
MWRVFQHHKSIRQRTTIHQRTATTSPQKHHDKNALFRQTPCKNALSPHKKS